MLAFYKHMKDSPALAPPGAGLPWLELQVARLRFAWRLRRGTPQAFDATFERERDAILDLVRPLEAVTAAQRRLIRRPRGLEDSSRDWSVWMTLDHLRITNTRFAQAITLLRHGRVPPQPASTAAVKPSPEVDAGVVAAFEASCRAFLEASAPLREACGDTTYAHPWFGPLDARGWQALAGFHLGLHRVQIERLLAVLARP